MLKNTKCDEYKDGLDMNIFTRIDGISSYNHNYYKGYGKDLLLGISDDDNTTDWYVIKGINGFEYIGYSLTSQNDILIKGCNT